MPYRLVKPANKFPSRRIYTCLKLGLATYGHNGVKIKMLEVEQTELSDGRTRSAAFSAAQNQEGTCLLQDYHFSSVRQQPMSELGAFLDV